MDSLPIYDNANKLMNSEMILRKNLEIQAEFDKVRKQIDELIKAQAKMREMKKAIADMVAKSCEMGKEVEKAIADIVAKSCEPVSEKN